MKGLTLNQREQTRLEILNRVLQGWVRMHEAGPLLGGSERQAWRLLAAYRKEGAAALAHGNRGRWPVNTTPPVVRDQVVTLARTQYAGLNHTHLTEFWLSARALGWRGQQCARSSQRLASPVRGGDAHPTPPPPKAGTQAPRRDAPTTGREPPCVAREPGTDLYFVAGGG